MAVVCCFDHHASNVLTVQTLGRVFATFRIGERDLHVALGVGIDMYVNDWPVLVVALATDVFLSRPYPSPQGDLYIQRQLCSFSWIAGVLTLRDRTYW